MQQADLTKARPGKEIRQLTGIRGVAACLVAIFHMNYWIDTGRWHGDPGLFLGTVFRVGYLGVDLFFVLSGYVIAHVYLDHFRRPDLTTYWRFLGRRVARIWPLHVFCLLLVVGGPRCQHLGTIAANLAMVHSWGIISHTTCDEPSWSISCEFFAYLAFPGLAWLLLVPWRGRAALPVAGLGAVGLVALCWFNTRHTLDVTSHFGVIRALCGFAIGAALCRTFASARRGLAFDLLGLVTLAGIAVLAATGAPDLYVAGLAGPLVVSVALCDGALKRVLSLTPVVWLGNISYSVYLLHDLMIGWFHAAGGEIASSGRVALALCVICIVASFSYVLIERPARRAVVRVLDGLIPSAPAVRRS